MIKNIRHFFQALHQMFLLVWHVSRLNVFAVSGMTTLRGLFPMGQAWLGKALFDQLGQLPTEDANNMFFQTILLIITGQACLQIIANIIEPFTRYLQAELSRRLSLHIEYSVYERINSFSGIAYFERPKFYDTVQLGLEGAQRGANNILSALPEVWRNIITFLSFVGVAFAFNKFLAVLAIVAALPKLIVHLRFGKQRYGLSRQQSPEHRIKLYYQHILTSINTAKELRLFGAAKYFLDLWLKVSKRMHKARRHQERHEIKWDVFLETSSTLVAKIALGVVVLQVINGQISLGDVIFFTSAVSGLGTSLSGLFLTLSSLSEDVQYFSEYENLMSLEEPLQINSHPVSDVPCLKNEIELQNVSFRYSDNAPWVLHNINLTIPAKRSLAIVGLNGSGKTTLVKLLTRLYDPTQGKILWDGIDIRQFDPNEFRQKIGAVFQDFQKYELTARENIGIGEIRELDDYQRIQIAAKKAGLHLMIENLPSGFDTQLGRTLLNGTERVDLSGGEWQKIAIARMFMRNASMLILDEPTSALDAQSEYELFSRFATLVNGENTCLMISHRFSTVRMADTVAVLENGVITEYGSHDELHSAGNTYAKLFQMQAEKYG